MISTNLEAESDDSLGKSLSKTIAACQKARIFMVALYLIEKSRFVHINERLKLALGNHYERFKAEGFDFWYSLIQSERRSAIKNHISKFIDIPVLNNRIIHRYNITLDQGIKRIRHEIVIRKLEGRLLAVNYILDITEMEEIERSFGILDKTNGQTELRKMVTHLSKRHKEILQLVSDGYTTKEIADLLFLSEHTVSVHRKNLMKKFRVKNTAQLIKKAWSGIMS